MVTCAKTFFFKFSMIDEMRSVLNTKELIIEQQDAELKESQQRNDKEMMELKRRLEDNERQYQVRRKKYSFRFV